MADGTALIAQIESQIAATEASIAENETELEALPAQTNEYYFKQREVIQLKEHKAMLEKLRGMLQS